MTQNGTKLIGWTAAILIGVGLAAFVADKVLGGPPADSPDPKSDAYKLDGDVIEVNDDAAATAGIRQQTVQAADVPMTLTLTARTGLNMELVTHVHAQFGGKVLNVGPELGSFVKGPGTPGGPTVLCIIESNDLAQAKANWLQAAVQLKLDDDALVRTRELVNSTVLAPKFLIDAESAVTKDKAALEAAKQQLLIFGLTQKEIDDIKNQVGRQRMDYVITSPRTGVIAEKGVAGGEVADPTLNLFTVADTSSMWLWGDVYEKDLPHIKVGEPVKAVFTSEPDRVRKCHIEWISPVLDPNTHSVKIRCQLDNADGHLLSDMYGTMVVTVDEGKNSIVVTSDAVVRQDDKSFVFVQVGHAGNKTRYRRTPVNVEPVDVGFGASDTSSAAVGSAARNASQQQAGALQPQTGSLRIVEGLKAGDVIVINGGVGLFNEMQEQANAQ